jgi:hypothetical protein
MNPRPTFIADKSWHSNIANRDALTAAVILERLFPPVKPKSPGIQQHSK